MVIVASLKAKHCGARSRVISSWLDKSEELPTYARVPLKLERSRSNVERRVLGRVGVECGRVAGGGFSMGLRSGSSAPTRAILGWSLNDPSHN